MMSVRGRALSGSPAGCGADRLKRWGDTVAFFPFLTPHELSNTSTNLPTTYNHLQTTSMSNVSEKVGNGKLHWVGHGRVRMVCSSPTPLVSLSGS